MPAAGSRRWQTVPSCARWCILPALPWCAFWSTPCCGQSLGFGLGSGIGYVLAVLLVTEARHRLRSKAIPEAFRGLPITLVYIGVLALAIYGFTGHSVIL